MSFLKNTATIILAAVILSMIAFVNGYPLVYSDTGTYINSGWTLIIPIDRPIIYGLFIRIMGASSLWTVIFVQNIFTSFILYESFKYFFTSTKKVDLYFIATVGFLTLTTGIAWYSNQLMPDFLTPIMLLSIFLLFFQKNMSVFKFCIISAILIFSIIIHFSHLIMASAMAILILLSNFILFKKWFVKYQLQVSLKRGLVVSLLACSGWVVLPTLNKMISGEFYNSKSSHVFFVASMADKGILQSFLNDKCDDPDYSDCKLCSYKNEIPKTVAAYIWDERDSSVFNRTGGWLYSKTEYNRIIKASLTEPKYLFRQVYMALNYGGVQLVQNKIGHGLSTYLEGTAPDNVIKERYKNEYNMYINSKQNKAGELFKYLSPINYINQVLLILSLVILIPIYFLRAKKKFNKNTVLFLSIILLGIMLNSFITAGLSAPYGRYQTRVVWLMEFALIIFGLINWESIKGSIQRKI